MQMVWCLNCKLLRYNFSSTLDFVILKIEPRRTLSLNRGQLNIRGGRRRSIVQKRPLLIIAMRRRRRLAAAQSNFFKQTRIRKQFVIGVDQDRGRRQRYDPMSDFTKSGHFFQTIW